MKWDGIAGWRGREGKGRSGEKDGDGIEARSAPS